MNLQVQISIFLRVVAICQLHAALRDFKMIFLINRVCKFHFDTVLLPSDNVFARSNTLSLGHFSFTACKTASSMLAFLNRRIIPVIVEYYTSLTRLPHSYFFFLSHWTSLKWCCNVESDTLQGHASYLFTFIQLNTLDYSTCLQLLPDFFFLK